MTRRGRLLPMHRIAIIICTRDRAESLRATLASLAVCRVPPDVTAEALVVDNGSTDGTAEVVRAAQSLPLPIRFVFEPQPGQVHARNAGLRAAGSAEAILFTDDDVRPPPDWIEGMCRPILAGQADAVSGWVHFPSHYEALLSREPYRSRRGWFASTEDIDPSAPGRQVGANMAFNRRVVEKLGEFDPELGPGALGFFDDTLWSARLQRAGFRLVAAGPSVSVEHHFDRARLTRPTLLSMAERMGRSAAWVEYHWENADPRVPAWTRWKARWLLRIYRALTPWRRWQKAAPAWELQRVEVQAYYDALPGYAGQPRKYPRG